MGTNTIKKLYRIKDKNYTVSLMHISGDMFQVSIHAQDQTPKTGTLIIKQQISSKNKLFFELNKQVQKAHITISKNKSFTSANKLVQNDKTNKSYTVRLCKTNTHFFVQSLTAITPAYGLPKNTQITHTNTLSPILESQTQNHNEHTSSLADPDSLKAPLAGKVIKVLAQPNQSVTFNQPLVIIESMKMENEICAPYDAFIKTLPICTGDLVKVGQVLMVFEKKGDHNATTKDKHEREETTDRGSC